MAGREVRHIQVFEHDHLSFVDQPEALRNALAAYHGEQGVPYYTLTRNGVKFCNWVGALQVGRYTIEVLPKIDRQIGEGHQDKANWQKALVDMLRQSKTIETSAPTEANLKLKSNSILDLYIDLFIHECEYLMNRGLIKRYRSVEGNLTSLKGALVFPKHIAKNTVHKERFCVRYTTYDPEHTINLILLKTVRMLKDVSSSPLLKSRIGALMLRFPDWPDIRVSHALFDRLRYDRKSLAYKNTMEIARLLLLNYHPDISKGGHQVLALMFDMNVLWETWVARRLAVIIADTRMKGIRVHYHNRKPFWYSDKERMVLEPDVVLELSDNRVVIVDTKWKVVDRKPGPEDVRQMFAYNHRFAAKESYLLYPAHTQSYHMGRYALGDMRCSLVFLPILQNGRLSDHYLKEFLGHLSAF